MRFPSFVYLAEQATVVWRRFPATLLAGAGAATAAIIASLQGAGANEELWARVAFVAALGLPTTVALTLLAEARGWSAVRRTAALLAAAAALALFFAVWNGVEEKHEAIRFVQLAAALHLVVAFLPFLGTGESIAFWQYNRRLFLGFLRAVVFSGVLFTGIAVALGALDKLFGVDIDAEIYLRIWFVVALVINTWIFLASVPPNLAALQRDIEYPRALKIFAQYILTPLVFTYLVILLAYLVKIVIGGEWPSGWVGWLVGSVSVTGLLGWLLVHPLRADPGEAWIRTYTRWLFIGLVPAALMLLVAFWKRIVPYGLTEPRVLGLVLGLWLLGIALLFTVKSTASIRIIPITLATLLLATLYGPVSTTRVSVASQGRRFATMLSTRPGSPANAREASAALRFLLEHRARPEIAAAVGRPLPPIDWKIAPRYGAKDSLGMRIMALAGATYVSEYESRDTPWFSVNRSDQSPLSVTGFDWIAVVTSGDTAVRTVGPESVGVLTGGAHGVARIRVGADTLEFDLRPLARRYADSSGMRFRSAGILADSLRATLAAGRRQGVLALTALHGRREADSLRIDGWSGWLLLRSDSVAAAPQPAAAGTMP